MNINKLTGRGITYLFLFLFPLVVVGQDETLDDRVRIIKLQNQLVECQDRYDKLISSSSLILHRIDTLSKNIYTYLPKDYIAGISVLYAVDSNTIHLSLPFFINRHILVIPGYRFNNTVSLGLGHQFNSRSIGSVYMTYSTKYKKSQFGFQYYQNVFKDLYIVGSIETTGEFLFGLNYNFNRYGR